MSIDRRLLRLEGMGGSDTEGERTAAFGREALNYPELLEEIERRAMEMDRTGIVLPMPAFAVALIQDIEAKIEGKEKSK